MSYPLLTVDLKKISDNARVISDVCRKRGVEMVGVVKACLGNRAVAEAMIAGGVGVIADSRLASLSKLKGLAVPLMMLRQPMLSEITEAVSVADIFLVSESKSLRLISEAASNLKLKPRIIVMVELGDLREGLLPEDVVLFIKRAKELPNIDVAGIGTNVACLQGVSPTSDMLKKLTDVAERTRYQLEMELPVISGGNSSAWKLINSDTLPEGINQLRFGEGIMLGRETIDLDPIEGASQDAVVLKAEIIEIKNKPVTDREQREGYLMERAILGLGSQDICCGELKPLDGNVLILKSSSDHLVVNIDGSDECYKVGDCMSFIPSYEAMLAAMTSPFVKKIYFNN